MRVKSVVYTRRRKKKTFRLAKGYYSDKSRRWRQVKQQVERSLRYAYRDRKDRKKEFRKLWITRINALTREYGLSYSKFISCLNKAGIIINRKMLSEMAIHNRESFQKLIELVKTSNIT